ncbi:hypothetical protein TorRG33x02_291840 [Trema orientale]|uniref:Uncharacterized protein n=1 Tax=Trema orientale TaxID=63057 RepID=A0A2P5CAU2_TREOI|nr:hypothetical protein TorRG33x02_291840 [Trema orientale]
MASIANQETCKCYDIEIEDENIQAFNNQQPCNGRLLDLQNRADPSSAMTSSDNLTSRPMQPTRSISS